MKKFLLIGILAIFLASIPGPCKADQVPKPFIFLCKSPDVPDYIAAETMQSNEMIKYDMWPQPNLAVCQNFVIDVFETINYAGNNISGFSDVPISARDAVYFKCKTIVSILTANTIYPGHCLIDLLKLCIRDSCLCS